MLIIVRAGHEKTVTDIFEKWDLPCALIGRVTEDGLMRVKNHGVTVAEIPAKQLADEAPVYKRDARRPAHLDDLQKLDLAAIPEPPLPDFHAILLKLLATPDLASKRWVYRQYDHMVRVGTVVAPGKRWPPWSASPPAKIPGNISPPPSIATPTTSPRSPGSAR